MSIETLLNLQRFQAESDMAKSQQAAEIVTEPEDEYTPAKSIFDDGLTFAQYKSQEQFGNPLKRRADELKARALRNRVRLEGSAQDNEKEAERMRNAGISEEYIQEHINERNTLQQLSGEERLQNYLARLNGDKNTVQDDVFERDFLTKTPDELNILYGDIVATAKVRDSQSKFKSAANLGKTLTTGEEKDILSWDTAINSAIGLGQGIAQTVNGLTGLMARPLAGTYDAIANSLGYESNEEAKLVQQVAEQEEAIQQFGDKLKTSSNRIAAERQLNADAVSDSFKQLQELKYKKSGEYSDKRSQNKAKLDREFHKLGSSLNEKRTIVDESGKTILELGLSGGFAKAGAVVGSKAHNLMSKNLATKLKNKGQEVASKSSSTALSTNVKQADNIPNGGLNNPTQKLGEQKKIGNSATTSKSEPNWTTGKQGVPNSIKTEGKIDPDKLAKYASQSGMDDASVRAWMGKELTPEKIARAEKILAKKSISKEMAQNIGAAIGVGLYSGVRESGTAVTTVVNEVRNADPKKIIESSLGQEFVSKFEETNGKFDINNPEHIKELNAWKEDLLKGMVLSAHTRGFLGNALVGAMFSSLDRKVGGVPKVGKAPTSIKKQFAERLTSLGKEVSQEAFEEILNNEISNVGSKYQVNTEFGSDIIDIDYNRLSDDLYGATLGALGAGGPSVISTGKYAAATAVTKGLETAINKQEKVKEKKAEEKRTKLNTDFSDMYGSEKEVDTDTTEIPNTTEPSKATTTIFGKEFKDTNFGKAYKDVKESTSETIKEITKDFKGKSYVENLMSLAVAGATYQNEYKAYMTEGKEKEANESLNKLHEVHTAYQSLVDALDSDIFTLNEEVSNKYNEIKELQKDPNTAISILQEKATELQKLMNEDSNIRKVMESSLYKTLNEPSFQERDTSKVSVTDILGSDLDLDSPHNIKDTVVSKLKEAAKFKDKRAAMKHMSDALFAYKEAMSSVKTAKPEEILKANRQLLNQYKVALKSLGDTKGFDIAQSLVNINSAYENSNDPNSFKVAQELFFGKSNEGLRFGALDVLNDYIKNNGRFSSNLLFKLNQLAASQRGKLLALEEAIKEINDTGNHLPLINPMAMGKDKTIYKNDGSKDPVDFNSKTKEETLNKAKKYKDIVANDVARLDTLLDIINGTDSKQTTSTNTPQNVEEQVDDNNIENKNEVENQNINEENEEQSSEPNSNTQSENQVQEAILEPEQLNIDFNENNSEESNQLENKTSESSNTTVNNETNSNSSKQSSENDSTQKPERNINKKLKASKENLRRAIVKSFNTIKNKWGGKDYQNDLTNTEEGNKIVKVPFELEDGSIYEFEMPMSAVVELYRRGIDLNENALLDLTTDVESHIEFTEEQLQNLLKDPTDETLLDILGVEKTNENKEYLESFAKVLNQVSKYYETHQIRLFDKDSKGTDSFNAVTSMLNLVTINGTEATVDIEVQSAIARGISKILADAPSLAFGKSDQYSDYFIEDKGAVSWTILGSNNVEKFGKTTKKKVGKELVNVDKRDFKGLGYEIIDESMPLNHLGITKNDFIRKLGSEILAQLGKSINKSSATYTKEIEEGLINAIGIEAYNIMLNQNYLQTFEVDFNNASISNVPYVNFKTNVLNEDSKIMQAFNVLTEDTDSDNLTVAKAKEYLAKSDFGIQASMFRTSTSEAFNAHLNQEGEESFAGVHISSLSGKEGKHYKPHLKQEVKDSKTKSDLDNRNNKELDQAIKAHNAATFAFNMPLFSLLQSNPTSIKLALGFVENVDSLNVTDATKKAIRSKNNQISRAIGLLNKYAKLAQDKGLTLEDTAFNFEHHFVSNMRVMLEADMNPQSDKIVREMLRLVQRSVNQESGKIEGELQYSFNLSSKNFKSKEPRTIDMLLKQAKSKRKSDARQASIAMVLALVQGLDLGKIEKTRTSNIFDVLEEAFNPNLENYQENLSQMVDILWNMQQGNETNNPYILSKKEQKVMAEFGSKMGNAAPRALNALQTLANFKYRNTDKDLLKSRKDRVSLQSSLLLESDGITNGMYNITREFSLSLNDNYINSLKRTGTITMDVLTQQAIVHKRTKVSELEGSAGMFSGYSDNDATLQDTYEIIASKLADKANHAIEILKANGVPSFTYHDMLDPRSYVFRDNKNVKQAIQTLTQLYLSGNLKVKEGEFVINSVFEPNKNLSVSKDLLLEVKRNLAKAGVTPTVYGGQLTGIANQLYNNTKNKLQERLDELLKVTKEYIDTKTPESKEKVISLSNEIKGILRVLGINDSTELTEHYQKELDKWKKTNQGKDTRLEETRLKANMLLNRLSYNKDQFIKSLKEGLAKDLHEAVQDSYVDEFANLGFAMAQDEIAFTNFITEFIDKLKAAVQERNEQKGYSKDDPRRHTMLTRKELSNLLKSITSAPIISTAFSQNAELFEDVYELGNSLVKFGSVTTKEQTTLNSITSNKKNNKYSRLITTQIFQVQKRYLAAGASNATSTIPSTEAKTQVELANEMLESLSGLISLDVFDGVDAVLWYSNLFGELANKITNNVHLNTNLLKSFYDRFLKNGIDKDIYKLSTSKPKFTLSGSIEDIFKKSSSMAQVKYQLNILTLVQMQLEDKKLSNNYTNESYREVVLNGIKAINGLKQNISRRRDNILYGILLNENSLNDNSVKAIEDSLKVSDLSYLLNPALNQDQVYKILANSYNNTVETFASKVAKAHALKQVEKKFLPSIINQFGGANRGYYFNEDKFKGISKRFLNYLKQQGVNIHTTDFRLPENTHYLSDFFAQDTEIQNEYTKQYDSMYKKLDKSNLETKKSTKEIKDVLNAYHKESEVKNIKDLKDNIISTLPDNALGNVLKLLLNSPLADDIIVFTDSSKMADTLFPTNEKRNAEIKAKSNSAFIIGENGTKGILLKDTGSNIHEIFAHELVHGLLNPFINYLAGFETNPENQRKYGDIGTRTLSLMNSIISRGKYHKNVQEYYNFLKKYPYMFNGKNDLNTIKKLMNEGYIAKLAYNPMQIAIANMMFLQDVQNNLSQYESIDLEKLSIASRTAYHEFIAYAFTNPTELTELSQRKEDKSLWDSIKNFFKGIRDSVLKILGMETAKDSELQAVYEIIHAVNEQERTTSTKPTIDSLLELDFPSSSSIGSSKPSNHEKKLIKYIDTFNRNISKLYPTSKKHLSGFAQELKMVQDSLTDGKVDTFLRDLRNLGIPVSNIEEEALKLAVAANTANFMEGNVDLQQQASNFISDLLKHTDLNQTNPKLFKHIFSNKDIPSDVLVTALLATNEHLAKQLIQNQPKGTKTQELLKRLIETANNLSIFKEVPADFKDQNAIDQIQYASMLFSFRNKISEETKQDILNKEYDKQAHLEEVYKIYKDNLDKLPELATNFLSIGSDAFTGKDLLQDGSGADSSIGQLVRVWLENHNEIHGRDTLLSQATKWVIGQDFNRQYSAKFKGEVDQTSQAIRERIAAVIPLSLRNQFENLTQEDEQALDNVLNSSELNRIASISITGMKTSDILKDSKMRSQAVLDTIQNIKDDLSNYYEPKQVEQITNYLVWQSKGLGQQMVTGEVRTKSIKENGQILPNAKVIASLRHIPKVANKTTEEQNLQILETYVGQLASLYSLNHQNQDDLNVLADLFENEPKGMDALIKSQDQLNQELNIQRQGNYLGQDGFMYNKKNPNQEVKLVDAKDLEQQRNLSQIGYKHKADLVTGEQVWVTNDSMTSRFTTGIFGLADTSIKGINQQSGKPIKGVYGKTQYNNTSTYFDNHPALKDHNYYDKLGSVNSSNTQINAQGDIIGSYNGLPKSLENQFIQSFESGIDAIGNMKGRLMEEIATEQNNQHYINELNKVYNRSNNKNVFTLVDGNYKPKSNKPTDIEFANRLNNIYNSLPLATKEQIAKQGGLYIETQEINNILGYSQSSVTDLWTGKSVMDPRLQKVVKSVFELTGQLMGLEGNQVAKRFERGLSEVVSLGKDFVLNRSVVVPAWNMFSNVIHLWNRGIPYNKIIPLVKEGTQNILKYNKDMNRLTELYHLRDISEGKDKFKYDAEINVLRKALDKNPVKPLVDEGILTSITLDNKSNEDKEFNYIPQLQRKFKFDKFKQTTVGKVWGNIAIQDGSWTHDTMEQILDLGDFVAKYAMYQHLTKDRGFNSDRAMNVIRDEFINYSYNRGRVFDYLNKMGLTWFLSYKLGIQKIVLRSLRRNFFRTSAIYAGAKASGINNVVPMQNLVFDGSLNYQTDATNIISAFGSHWFSMLKP